MTLYLDLDYFLYFCSACILEFALSRAQVVAFIVKIILIGCFDFV